MHASTAGPETHGKYLSDCEIHEPEAFITSKEGWEVQERLAAELFNELFKELETIERGVSRNF